MKRARTRQRLSGAKEGRLKLKRGLKLGVASALHAASTSAQKLGQTGQSGALRPFRG